MKGDSSTSLESKFYFYKVKVSNKDKVAKFVLQVQKEKRKQLEGDPNY